MRNEEGKEGKSKQWSVADLENRGQMKKKISYDYGFRSITRLSAQWLVVS